ncbi:hypothetical protein LCGC14_0960820 [marine sediment metagenome]|uniref:Uncharacterized protein n=1 Tax=marine sediment metagenome TaxID=412755 RepID=A0A0F9QXQ2_9ZZZZ
MSIKDIWEQAINADILPLVEAVGWVGGGVFVLMILALGVIFWGFR